MSLVLSFMRLRSSDYVVLTQMRGLWMISESLQREPDTCTPRHRRRSAQEKSADNVSWQQARFSRRQRRL